MQANVFLTISIIYGTKDNNDNQKNKKAAMLNEREAAYRGEGATIFFIFDCCDHYSIYFYNINSGLSALSISLCALLVFCVIVYLCMLHQGQWP